MQFFLFSQSPTSYHHFRTLFSLSAIHNYFKIAMGSKKKSSGFIDKNSAEYRAKRIKNNNAVKRSRDKSKQKAMEATERVQRLQFENQNLRSTLENMTSELKYLKEMLICQAGSVEYLSPTMEADLEDLLRDDAPTDINKITNVLQEMRRIQSLQRPEPYQDITQGLESVNNGEHAFLYEL